MPFPGRQREECAVAPHDGDDFDHHDHQEAGGTDIKQHTAFHLGFHRIHAHAPSIRALMGGRPASPATSRLTRDDLRLMRFGNPWASRRLDLNRHETGLETSVVVDAHATEHGVYGFRVERSEEVGGVGSEPE